MSTPTNSVKDLAPKKTCSIPGCTRPVLARGLCNNDYMRAWREDGKPEKREKVFAQDVSFTRNQQEVLRLTARMNKVKLSELVRSIVDAWIRGRPSSYQPEQERASLSNPLTSLPPRRP